MICSHCQGDCRIALPDGRVVDCMNCNGTGEMCDHCGEAADVCDGLCREGQEFVPDKEE